MKTRLLFAFILLTQSFYAQETVDFESFGIEVDTFLDGRDADGAFVVDQITLPNIFTVGDGFEAWEGWAISSVTDNETPGFENQFSAIAGQGNGNSDTYAVSFNFGQNIIQINNGPQVVDGLFITNSTFAFISMRDGDAFAKRFGGATGDDPDFFFINIEGFRDGEIVDTIEFFLADFRFEDNTQDFILDEWTFLDLSGFGEVDSLGFTLDSSDVGQFGLNTPAYFCIDDIQLSSATTTSTIDIDELATIDLFPNPTSEYIQLRGLEDHQSLLNIYTATGQRVRSDVIFNGENYDVSSLESGTYIFTATANEELLSGRFVKH